MKQTIAICALIFIASFQGFAQECQLKVKVVGIGKFKGNMIFAIFNNEKDFLKKDFRSFTLPVGEDEFMLGCFDDLPVGKYAVSVIHDLDKSGDLSMRIYGPPSEPYGFSKNVRGFMGPPDFEDVSFDLAKGEKKELEIKVE